MDSEQGMAEALRQEAERFKADAARLAQLDRLTVPARPAVDPFAQALNELDEF